MTKNLRKAIMKRSQLEISILVILQLKIGINTKNIKTFAVNYTKKKGKSFILN